LDKSLTAHPGRKAHIEDGVTWYDAAEGERIAVRLPSSATKGAYTIVESVAAPGCGVPMHLHRNEDEHFVILAGTYRIACDDKIIDAPVGSSFTVPRGARHAWRNISDSTGRMLVVLTPGGFENQIQEIINTPADKLDEVLTGYGTVIIGPGISV
jgi:mannose-6-phosphate isomerase-like protein (cupin superfamily)